MTQDNNTISVEEIQKEIQNYTRNKDYTPRPIIAVMTKGLLHASTELNEKIKHLVEIAASQIGGFENNFYLSPEGELIHSRPSVTILWKEKQNRVIQFDLQEWLKGQAIGRTLGEEELNGISVMFFETDTTYLKVIAAWGVEEMVFGSVQIPQSSRNLNSYQRPQNITVDFGAKSYTVGEEAIAEAQVLLDKMNLAGKNPHAQEASYNPGDSVMLKSGGPRMFVIEVIDDRTVRCVWSSVGDKLQSEDFHRDTLVCWREE